MTNEEWIEKCADRFMEKAELPYDVALGVAESCLEELEFDTTLDPDDAADEEMLYWDE